MDQILIFRTNVNAREHIEKVEAILRSITQIKHWNFDLEDCDRILRIVASNLQPTRVEALLRKEDIVCEHMEYQLD